MPFVLHAQQGAAAAHPAPNASVSGRVETPGEKTELPVAGVMVTLHRVGQDSSGPVDSVRAGADGRYVIRYARPDTDQAVYFAAAVYRGIAYFSSPIRGARATGDDAAITVFDTTTHPIAFHVQGHHLVIAAPRPDGIRDVVEVWELSNDTSVTAIAKDSLSSVWTAPLPHGIQKFAGGQSDVSADALVARGNRVALIAPFGPGVKQISYTYSLPPSEFPLDVPIETPTSVMEVLVEEAGATVSGATLRATPAATTQGRTFKRFLGQDVPRGQQARITVPVTTAATRGKVLATLATVIAALMAFALWRALSRRAPRLPTPQPAIAETDLLVAAIADLDAEHDRGDTALSPDEYGARRAALKARLNALLANEPRPA